MTIQWPKFCDIPFKLVKIPEDLYRDIMEVYHKSKFIELINDNCYDSVYGDMTTGGSISFKTFPYSKNPFYLRATPPLEKFSEWASSLQPLLEEWSNEKLEFVNGYGIRSYVHDSILCLHRDAIERNVISCIVHIDEHPNCNWPLDFWDHSGKRHSVTFKPGEMLFYESLCIHGRITPFAGEYYRNMYFHWRPVGWDCSPYSNNKVKYSCTAEIDDEYR